MHFLFLLECVTPFTFQHNLQRNSIFFNNLSKDVYSSTMGIKRQCIYTICKIIIFICFRDNLYVFILFGERD